MKGLNIMKRGDSKTLPASIGENHIVIGENLCEKGGGKK